MLKFRNRDKLGTELIYTISMSSVQGGVLVDVDEFQKGSEQKSLRSRTVLLTPIDAAAFAHQTRITNGLSCRQVGHVTSSEGAGLTLFVQKLYREDSRGNILAPVTDREFIGDVAEVVLSIGGINMVVPTFVIDAMRLCVERMFETLMFPNTWDMEEEFGL